MGKETLQHKKPQLYFDLFIVLFAVVTLVASLGLNVRARYFPGITSIILLLMASLQLLADFWPEKSWLRVVSRRGVSFSPQDKNLTAGAHQSQAFSYGNVGLVVALLVAFFLLFRYLNVFLAIPLFLVVLLGLVKKESWLTVAGVALGADLFVWLVFVQFLKTRF